MWGAVPAMETGFPKVVCFLVPVPPHCSQPFGCPRAWGYRLGVGGLSCFVMRNVGPETWLGLPRHVISMRRFRDPKPGLPALSPAPFLLLQV